MAGMDQLILLDPTQDYIPDVLPSMPGTTASSGGTVMGVPQQSGGFWQTFSNLFGAGMTAYQASSAVNLAGQQISRGQNPTVIGQNGLLSGTANVSTANALSANSAVLWIMLGLVIVVALFMGRK